MESINGTSAHLRIDVAHPGTAAAHFGWRTFAGIAPPSGKKNSTDLDLLDSTISHLYSMRE